jgi:hypothetical protein
MKISARNLLKGKVVGVEKGHGARSAICCRAWVKAARLAVRIGR